MRTRDPWQGGAGPAMRRAGFAARFARGAAVLTWVLVLAGATIGPDAAESAGITVSPTAGLITTEAGGTAQFTVVLQTQPTDDVTIALSTSDATEGTISTSSLTFTSTDWSTAQSVTITGVNDVVNDGDIAYSIVTGAAVSLDAAYNGIDPDDVSVTNIDDDTAGITVNPTSGLVTSEAGGTAQFTVVLTSQPTASVSIGLSSSDVSEGTVAPASVTFTTANWNTAQTVTVTGVDDAIVDGSVAYTILTAAATSADPGYNGLDAANVSVTNTDNDAAGITVNPTSGLVTTETGGTAQFTVVLTSQPTASVSIGLSSSDVSEGTVALASITFTTGNWNTSQTVTVTGVDDAIVDGNVAYTILTAAATSADANYSGMDAANVSLTNNDNDAAGITVNPTSGLVTTEAGGTAQFTVVLTSQPTASVSIGLSSSDVSEGTVALASITFTTGNWNTSQTVTVTGVDDAIVDGNIAYSILTAAAASADANYSGMDAANVSLTNNDNDAAGITVNPTSGLVTTEAGGTAQFTLVLTSQPTANVIIGLSSSDVSEGTVAPGSVTFTTGNWNTAQTVTVTGVDDVIVDGSVAYTILTAVATSADPGYNGLDAANVAVTNTDNDAAGITVNPTSGLVTTEAGGTAQFTVVLTSQPTANVTIGITSSDLTEGTVAPASVTFTSGNWSSARTVTVTGVDDATVDGNVAYTILTAAATSADANYSGMDAANVSVTNNDNDAAGITVNPTSGLVTTEAGGTAQFTVVLTSQPTASVSVGLSSSDVSEGTVAPASVTFTTANWNVAQTVTVTGVDDAIVDGNVAYTILTAAATSADPGYNGLDAANVAVTNTDNDAAGITVNPTSGLVTTEAGGTAQFTIVLASQPTASVSVGLSSSDVSEGTVAPASVTFTTANWNVAQTVTVTGVNDFIDDGNVAYTILTAAATSADPGYNGLDAANVSVTNTDNDAAGITVNPTSGLVTTEAGGTAQFTIVLTSQPTASVSIGLSSSDVSEGTVAPASVTFTTANWNTAQTVTVTGVNDFIDDGNVAYTILTAAATSADPDYNGLDAANVAVTNTDNDAAGITVNPTSGLVTSEAGGTAQFTVVLTSQPTASVSVGLSSSDVSEGTVAPASVTFTTANWNVAQTVTVTGVDDVIVDGPVAYSIVTAPSTSVDPGYNGLNPPDVAATNTDNDAAGITVNPTSGLVTTEAGGTAQFTVVLTSQPTANVSVGLSSSDVSEGTVAPASVTFTTANWNTAQTVTVTGVNDFIDDGNVAYTILTAAATSADPGYNGLDAANVAVTNTDNDAAGITVNPTSGLVTSEAGGTAQFTVVLTSQPTASVSVGLSSSDVSEGTVAPASVTFTTANWNVAQTVTVTGVDDVIVDGSVAYTILTAAATSADPGYNGMDAANVSVTNNDNDAAGITVNPTSGLVTTEAGGTAQFTLVLTSQPTANVTIGLTSSDLTEGTVAPASITFTTGNWNTSQTLTVTGVDDAIVDGNVAYTILTAAAASADANYSGMDAANVSMTNNDNDTAGITVNPTSGLVTTEAGGTAQFTIVLQSQPTANVSIGITSSDLTEGTVSTASVTFTAANWNVAQTVTVTGVDDAIVDGSVAYTILTAVATSADPGYNGLDAANVAVTNTDNDAAGITVNPTSGLVTTEAGGTAQFTVVLTSQPTANVGIGLSSSDPTEGTVAPASLTFTSANWNTAQTVTVIGVDDAMVDGNIAYTIITAPATSIDPGYSGRNAADVSLTNLDNDVAGVTVTPVSGLVTSEAGGTAQFTVALATQPAAPVTIGLTSSDLTEGTVAPASLTFTTISWNVAQTVTVTGVDDLIVDGTIAYTILTVPAVSTDPNYNGLNPADVSASNTDNDAAGITVSPVAGLVTTEAGGTTQFTVVLNTEPVAAVSIALSSSDLTEGAVAPASLTFTVLNWNVAQAVTVTGVDDFLADGNIVYTIVTAPATSSDPNYSGLNPANVSVTNTDNDVAGITVNPVAGLVTNEAAGTAQFTVVLISQPTANVTIGLSSNDLTEGTVAPGSLVFTNANWNVARTVTVTGVDDALDDGDIAYSIITAPATSADPGYTGRNAADVGVTNIDNDISGFTVIPVAGLVTTEAGGTAQFTMALTSQPTANVSIGLSSSDITEGTVAPVMLAFTTANWNVAQTATVTGVDDLIVDGPIVYGIVSVPATSLDPGYNGLNPTDVAVTNTDNDAAGFTVNPIAGLVTTELGGTAQFTVTLTSQPSANVTVALSSSDLTEGTVAPGSLTFTALNWNVAQTVTVTGVDDFLADGSIVYTVITAPAVSADLNFNGVNPANVSVTNTDDDVAGITVDPVTGITTSEAGGTAQFTVVLTSQPTANVTIGLTSNDLTEGTVVPASLTFTAANWNVARTVTVTGVDDPIVDGPVAYTIVTAPATSADAGYGGRNAADVAVINIDNDAAGITVTPIAGLVTTESGGTVGFTVVLTSQPAANVSVGLASSDLTEGTVAPATITFSAADWNVAQAVTVTGVDDVLDDGDVAYTVITAAATSADGHYAGIDPADVSVTNQDDDSGSAVALELVPDRERVGTGQPVRYTLLIRNLTDLPLTRLEIRHELPPRFGYLAGSAARDGRGVADPTGARSQVFTIDSLPAFVDQNGDGMAGPGEPGHITLGWTLAPGASATPGSYGNSTVAFALDACAGCQVSNRAEASVRVEDDAVFARGTVLGRVFEDADRDGRQSVNEPGLGGAVVALDDGTSVTTDREGRFHLPDLDAGPRALKLDLARLGMPALPTTDVTQVVNVSPGLLATVRFGVAILGDTVRIGRPMGEGLAIVTDPMEHAVHVAGNAHRGSAVVNGRAVSMRTVDARLDSAGSGQILRLVGGRIDSTTAFDTHLNDPVGARQWWLEIRNARREVVRRLEGEGAPPERLPWGGTLDEDRRPRSGEVYTYQMSVAFADGSVAVSPRRAVGVERGAAIAMTLPGDVFQPGRAQLSLAAGDLLSTVAEDILRSPREVVIIEGHTDSVGPADANRRLSVRRAEAVADYLALHRGIPRGRLVVEGHGESRPVAGNGTEDGRELNRRIEIYGMSGEVKRARLYQVFSGAATARVGGLDVPVDSAGKFACRVPMIASDTLDVAMTNRLGRAAVARLALPVLEIVEPNGLVMVPFGESADGVRAEPRSALYGEPEPLAGLASAGSGRPVAHVRLRGRTQAGNRVELDGRPVAVESDGGFTTELALHVGENVFGLVVRDSAGTQREASLVVRAFDQQADRDAMKSIRRDPELTIHLPPRGSVLGFRELRLGGRTHPGNRVTVNRDTMAVEADGRFMGRVMLPEGPSVLTVVVEDPAGNRRVIDRDLEVRSKRLFLVGLADGVVGRTQGGAFVGAGDVTRTWTEGRIAYQLRGWIAGRYFISSAFDTRRRDFGTLFRDLDDAGRDRLLVNLDPDRLYPVFGDSSRITHGGPAGGRFFLAIESDAVRASVGDFPIAFDELELASFHRTLYGGQLRLATGGTGGGARGTSVALFGAEARSIHVRDAIRATGGTLYYLSHREAIEGSVQVALVVNDRDTGLPLRRMPLQRGTDFTVKEFEGRLLLTRPLPSIWQDGSLVDANRLDGHPVTIEVDYETRGSLGEKAAVGARVKQAAGPLTLGATAVDDRAGAGRYQIKGGDASLRLGGESRLAFELAESEGRSGRTYVSADGGLAFAPADTGTVLSGRAWKAAAELNPGEWRPGLARLRLGGYVKRIDSGFVAESRPGGEALEQTGLRLRFDAGGWGQWSARLDQDVRGATDSTSGRTHEVLGMMWRRDGARRGVATEFEQRTLGGAGAGDSTAGSLAGRVWWRPVDRLRATLEHQLSVSGATYNRTALGLDWRALSKLTLGARGSAGTGGRILHGDATLAMGSRSAYLREEHRDEFGRRSSGTVFGVQAPLGPSGRTYTEYQWQRSEAGDQALSVLGLEQGWSRSDGLALRVAGEHGTRAGAAGGADGRRTTVSSALTYRGRLPVSGSTRGEVRTDGGAARQRQYLVGTHLEWALTAGLTVRGDYRLSLAREFDLDRTLARFEERSVGLAYRPARSDRFQALARVTRLADRRLRSPGDSLSSESGLDVAALEATLRLTQRLEWSGKGAARVMRDGPGGLPSVATHGALWVNRLDYAFHRPLRLGVEYRRLTQRETGDERAGWLQELSLDPSRHLRFGLGYNFTRFSGDVLDRGEEQSKGWFVRAQSRY